jgi:hypothetical protein
VCEFCVQVNIFSFAFFYYIAADVNATPYVFSCLFVISFGNFVKLF